MPLSCWKKNHLSHSLRQHYGISLQKEWRVWFTNWNVTLSFAWFCFGLKLLVKISLCLDKWFKDCSSGLESFGPPACDKIILTEVEVSEPKKVIWLLVCLLVIVIASFVWLERHKLITKAVSISINYTAYLL